MSSSMASPLFLCICAFSLLGPISSSSLVPSMCPHQSTYFLNNLQSQSPLSAYPTHLTLEVKGEFLDRNVDANWGKGYTSILFYASSCSFSHKTHATFNVLSSMFPQIEHLAIEQSSAMPSTFSRYGIHSLPTIIMVNKSSGTRFQGAKDLQSLIKFYKKTTGLEPVHRVALEQPIGFDSSHKFVMQSWISSSVDEIINREPYLVLSLLFLCLRALVFVFPKVLSRSEALWRSYRPQVKLELFGEASHIVGRILHIVNIKRIWTELKLYKTRTFHQGALSAHVWASSLASVSLRKTTCSRL